MLKINHIRFWFVPLILMATLAYAYLASTVHSPVSIQVFAGNDTITCSGVTLKLSDLNASISGQVSDGQWTTTGDGRFMPGNVKFITFSKGTHYVPGTKDVSTGGYKLLLTSDDPDLDPVTGFNGPLVQVTDDVNISFQPPPPLFCNNNLLISLDANCRQTIDITILQSNPVPPLNHYIITLFDKNGNIIPNNTVTHQHLNQEVSFRIGHQCTQNICWGKFTVRDYFPPQFVCRNDTLPCFRSALPDSIGFPLPPGARIDTFINGKYTVSNWDACGKVTLEFTDLLTKANCAGNLDRTVRRTWRAVDESGNVSLCVQNIVFRRIGLNNVIFPPNYDDHQLPGFECLDSFPVLANGHPSPDTTGVPFIGGCTHLQANYSDTRFDLCGSSFKIARTWFVIEWCTAESLTRNQLIVVRDSVGPLFACPDSLLYFAGPYSCATGQIAISPPSEVRDCSSWTWSASILDTMNRTLPQFMVFSNNQFHIQNLPVGTYLLRYTLTDACNNSSFCDVSISVRDNLAPTAICSQITKVALGQNGRARLFASSINNNSIDNCGILHLRIRKMTDACNFGIQFGEFVDFCCAELGNNNMVALQVTDIHGNVNTCMAEVWVEDKIPPVITCPPNLTIACTTPVDTANLNAFGKVVTGNTTAAPIIIHDAYNNGIAGYDGRATDNCTVTVTSKSQINLTCAQGTIRRTFIAIDGDGRRDSCVQTITVRNPNPFNAGHIIWPPNYTGNGCHQNQANPDITGRPTFTHTSCNMIASTYEDQRFFLADSACVKILRSWTVIDWCQFNEISGAGRWGPYVQIIKLSNFIPPVIVSGCADTTFCSLDAECRTGQVEINLQASDDCTAGESLMWSYTLDLFRDGTTDSVGSANKIAAFLPIGSHRIIWRVTDGCGNSSSCIQNFNIVDCKKPTPYCLSSFTTSLMQPAGMVEVWAKDFDLGSFDNCTALNQLQFSFSAAQIQSARTFTCADIPDGISENIPLRMYVTDERGNQDYCDVELVLQDNANVCPDVQTSSYVDGYIRTEAGRVPKGARVRYTTGVEPVQSFVSVDQFGYYNIESVPTGQNLVLKPALSGDPLDGVTTLDLLFIQRHILGMAPFTSPYKFIAADANASGTVTAADIVDIRKIILGLTSAFPKNQAPWKFIDKKYVFQDIENPWFAPDSIMIPLESPEHLNNDFVAVKLGDVNDSYVPNLNQSTETRSRNFVDIWYDWASDEAGKKMLIGLSEQMNIEGIQLALKCDDLKMALPQEGDVNLTSVLEYHQAYRLRDQWRIVAYSAEAGVAAGQDGQILSLEVQKEIPDCAVSLMEGFLSEIYMHGQAFDIRLTKRDRYDLKPSFKLLTNPAVSNLHLSILHDESVRQHYNLVDMNGRQCQSGYIDLNPSQTEYHIALSSGLTSGVYYLHWTNVDTPPQKVLILHR